MQAVFLTLFCQAKASDDSLCVRALCHAMLRPVLQNQQAHVTAHVAFLAML